ncbi:MAG TPA: hypothetical protein VMT31_08770 [Methanomicrobiales archaeon]|nr:hypothetical protein [Methanomicrobiales archaeon]
MFGQPRFSYTVMALLLVLPQNLYVIGDYIAWGIRFPFFRLQDSVYGSSFIPIHRELVYILAGQVRGGTVLATILWLAGVILLLAAAALVVSRHQLGYTGHARYPGPLLVTTGILFLAWAVVQYGPLLSGPGGYAIPVGVPILWFCGWQFMEEGKEAVKGASTEE